MVSLENIAKARIESFLREINKLAAIDFPYEDSKKSLIQVKREFIGFQEALEKANTEAALADATIQSLWACREYFPLLGFILRSTNVRNAFELFGPIKRLCVLVLGIEVDLLLSSEWTLSPVTAPVGSGLLPNYVTIGMPATESSNPLVIPLAGHELGHSLWRQKEYHEDSSCHSLQVCKLADTLLDENEDAWNISGECDRISIQEVIEARALCQCEEMFCDYVGIGLFGKSYLEAFRYIVAPGLEAERDGTYPAVITRASLLKKEAEKLGIEKIHDYEDLFLDENSHDVEIPVPTDLPLADFLTFASDRIALQMAKHLGEDVHLIIDKPYINKPLDTESTRILRCFQMSIPAIGVKSIADIINAGWIRYYEIEAPSFTGNRKKSLDVLRDLMLKSLEILEVEIKFKAAGI